MSKVQIVANNGLFVVVGEFDLSMAEAWQYVNCPSKRESHGVRVFECDTMSQAEELARVFE